jgi:hypothetical protein
VEEIKHVSITYAYIYVYDGIMHSVFRFICQWVPFPTLAGNQNSFCLSSRNCSSPIIRGSHTTLLFLFHPVCRRSRLRLWQLIYCIRYNIIWSVSFSPCPFLVYALITSTRAWCVMCVYSVGASTFVCIPQTLVSSTRLDGVSRKAKKSKRVIHNICTYMLIRDWLCRVSTSLAEFSSYCSI